VNDKSVCVGINKEKMIPMPGYDHKGISRHGSIKDSGLKIIFSEIRKRIAKNAAKANASEYCEIFRYLIAEVLIGRQSFIPFERNEKFVGQQTILKRLQELFGTQPRGQKVALYGLGGIG